MPQLKNRLLNVMVVEDDEDDYFIMNDYLQSITSGTFKSHWCHSYSTAIERMRQNDCDICFVDYRLGIKTGLDFINQSLAEGSEMPFILLTGKGNPEIDRQAVVIGATDYLVKGELTPEKLERCIRYALERSATLKALKANEKKYRTIFEKSKDAIFIGDHKGRLIQINTAGLELLQLDPSQIDQYRFFDFIIDHGAKKNILELINNGEEIKDYEVELKTSTGQVKYCLLTLSNEDSDNHTIYYQGIIHDITERKRNEKASLNIEKLAAAGRLVRTLAHEVRNPLNNINLSLEQLMDIMKDDESHVYMEIINRNSGRINSLITELLQSLRFSEIKLMPVSLQEVIHENLNVAKDTIALKSISLDYKEPEMPVMIMGDKEKLHLAFSNLINNAVEAIEKCSGKLTIAIEDKAKPSVYIQDNGIGMSREDLGRLFEPYYTTKRNGMGLGMPSTLNILQAHNAFIDVKSEPGEGTTFTITFEKA
ncbi:ATP-binding response regulator [Pinibacter soli]|uniref:histidine kinase n=1 Tax=Pinibacter soli TaxID=3044211 RepID=A0ABT6RJ83_9BACT|nr:ATP-binding protein [Pinibacter soli]MDI3322628.1 ATP-binding protein [Pinibacter soli]